MTRIETKRLALIEVQDGPFPNLIHVEVEGVVATSAQQPAVSRVMFNLTLEEAHRLVLALQVHGARP